MKLTGFLIIAVILQVSISVNAQTINLSAKEVPLVKIFSIIKKQTGTLFFYEASLMDAAKPVTVELKNSTLETALNEIFKDQPLTWTLEDKTVTVSKKPGTGDTPAEIASQQPSAIEVKGNITDENGHAIIDVSVAVKGKKQGTIADSKGRYSIKVHPKDILVFSSVSYGIKEVKVESGTMNIKMELDVKPMESYIMGGNLMALKRKADATSVTIIDSRTLEKIPANTIDQIFRGWVPGTNSFDVGDAPEGFPTLSIRGAASQTSLATIAVYIDGIEYAGGSGFLSQLDKSNIDRIEIVRGPGASTMYGTGSNGGIVQIFTKKGTTNQTAVNFTSSAGFYQSKWVSKNAFQQLHNLELTTGFQKVALTLGATYRTVDAYLPDGGEKNKGFYLDARFDLGKLQVNMSGRYNARNYSFSRNPVYDTAIHPRIDIILTPAPGFNIPAYEYFTVKPTTSNHKNGLTETYFVGINLSHQTTKYWVNKLDAGYTSNDNDELPVLNGTTPLQSQYLGIAYNTSTVRYSNTLTLTDNSTNFNATLLSGLEYKNYSSSRTYTRSTAASTQVVKDPDNKNYGAFVQLNPSYKNVYLTMGLRYEKNELFKAAFNPRIGLTTNFNTRSLTFKPRISWGKGITAPTYRNRFGSPPSSFSTILANPDIKPQSQQGFDYGLEVYDKKGKFKFEMVYYDNILKDMITEVILPNPPGAPAFPVTITSANAAQVLNKGWEFSAEYKIKHFSLQGSFSIINTTIGDTAGSYQVAQFKGKAPGTRMPNLPQHIAGLSFTYNFFKLFGKNDRGSVSVNLTEVDGVKYQDRINYNLDVAYGRTTYDKAVFGYQVESEAAFRLGFNAEYEMVPGLSVFAQGGNILNDYHYEYTNEYPTHGATWLFGLKYSFAKKNNGE